MDAKEEIKQRLSVEEVIGEYIELKRAGRNFKALSPFSAEKSPSFMVSPEKGIWHDFSSNQGGDVFSFVMLMEGVDFVEAMRILAPKAGVDLSQFRSDGTTAARKKRLHQALQLAVSYYQKSLVANKAALAYVVEKRGYGKQVIQDFGIGFAPAQGNALLKVLSAKGFTAAELNDAGLATQSRGTIRDMFRNRIMIPLHDAQGAPIGFTARVLDDGLPKYINTPQTLLYDKSRHVFGLHLAKESIRKQGFVVLVEGNLDVIASHKAGIKNVVATAGTAMTTGHLKQLNRLTQDIRLAFDSDAAGLRATERAIPLAQETGVTLSIIEIQGGKDPDDLIKQDPSLWQNAIDSPLYVMDWLIKSHRAKHDLSSAEGKRLFTDTTLSILSAIQDPVEVSHYVGEIARLVHVDEKSILQKLEQLRKPAHSRQKKKPKNNVITIDDNDREAAYQDLLLGMNLLFDDLADSFREVAAEFFWGAKRQQLAKFVLSKPRLPLTQIPSDLQQIEDYVKIVLFKAEELYADWPATDRLVEAIGLARRLTRDYTKKRKHELSNEIREAEEAGDETQKAKLLQEFSNLIKEIG